MQVAAWVRVFPEDLKDVEGFEGEVYATINPGLQPVGCWGESMAAVSLSSSLPPIAAFRLDRLPQPIHFVTSLLCSIRLRLSIHLCARQRGFTFLSHEYPPCFCPLPLLAHLYFQCPQSLLAL